uniref:Uncharacterized protein n=1 Tax=Pseudo-nitzschia australis TaxID=44445 RepID=A0A7S4EF84_9STRA
MDSFTSYLCSSRKAMQTFSLAPVTFFILAIVACSSSSLEVVPFKDQSSSRSAFRFKTACSLMESYSSRQRRHAMVPCEYCSGICYRLLLFTEHCHMALHVVCVFQQ